VCTGFGRARGSSTSAGAPPRSAPSGKPHGATAGLTDRVSAPALDELRQVSGGEFDLSTEAVLARFGITIPAALATEIADLEGRLERRFEQTNRHPADWRVEAETGSLLYALVRIQQPEVVVETSSTCVSAGGTCAPAASSCTTTPTTAGRSSTSVRRPLRSGHRR
jgi:hypothetical protein